MTNSTKNVAVTKKVPIVANKSPAVITKDVKKVADVTNKIKESSIMVDKIEDSPITPEKDVITEFKKILTSNIEFVQYEDVKDWIGYKNKTILIDLLTKDTFGFVEKKDYYFEKIKKDNVFKPINEIFMTPDTIKSILASSQTKDGQKFIKHLIDSEKKYIQIVPIKQNNKYDFDVNNFKGGDVIYLIHVKDNLYKFGVTQNIIKRLKTHKTFFKYDYVVKCWMAVNRTIGKRIEDHIKMYMKEHKFKYNYENSTEIFETINIDPIIDVINKYVKDHVQEYNKQFNDAKLQQIKECRDAKIECLKYELERGKQICDTIDKINMIETKINTDSKIEIVKLSSLLKTYIAGEHTKIITALNQIKTDIDEDKYMDKIEDDLINEEEKNTKLLVSQQTANNKKRS